VAYVGKGVVHTRRDEWDEALHAFETAARLGNASGAQYAAEVRRIRGLPPAPAVADPARQAWEAFSKADSHDALRQAVNRHPILARPDYLAALEHFVAEQVPAPQRAVFGQRLDWLRQLAASKANP
jgi:hypothetical protein